MLRYIRLLGLVVVGVFADVFDDLAQVVLVVSNELGVFLLLVEEYADFGLFMCEFALEVGYAGSWGIVVSGTVLSSLDTGKSTHKRSLCWLLGVRGLLHSQLHVSGRIWVSSRQKKRRPEGRDLDELKPSTIRSIHSQQGLRHH